MTGPFHSSVIPRSPRLRWHLQRLRILAFDSRFPGLARVASDTHLFRATLSRSKNILEKSDWIPFREGLRPTQSLLILGRATLSAVDAENPASFSRKVAQGIVRNCRGHECILVTDDRAIAPVVRHGKCDAGVDAVNPGTDLLLVFYDADRYYTARHCSIKARTDG